MASAHVSAVRSLYKKVLTLHKLLPNDIRAIGDQYVKDEFKRHKNATNEQAKQFMLEWQAYAASLTVQLKQPEDIANNVGAYIPDEKLDDFNDEQVEQLHELFQETTKPKTFQPVEER
ncbi:succinate dehydrogenase assembly factor 3, mitochondrial-like [Saccoglossus kowalevskii]|uniref:Succinate dehydrogenase assembly factor 3 n=1 Tax=Saccoglossus kowalevskii TaxID=10224 RepID=A0ABM0H0W2_SACKO|nr:PREDICTED: protein ACN9 homolog, mitochondrial-like [Saccoglossus kowalevskii]